MEGLSESNIRTHEVRDLDLPQSLMSAVMDQLAHGIIVADVLGHVLHANEAARHELAAERVFAVRDRRLQACVPTSDKTLQEAMARGITGKRSLIDVQPAQGACLSVAVTPLRDVSRPHGGAVALVFARNAVCDALMLCFFARSHGLTRTEEQVLGILCQGLSAPQVAKQLNVAVSTVRSHVRSLCAKTRTAGVRELVSRVAVLPPVAPAFRQQPVH